MCQHILLFVYLQILIGKGEGITLTHITCC